MIKLPPGKDSWRAWELLGQEGHSHTQPPHHTPSPPPALQHNIKEQRWRVDNKLGQRDLGWFTQKATAGFGILLPVSFILHLGVWDVMQDCTALMLLSAASFTGVKNLVSTTLCTSSFIHCCFCSTTGQHGMEIAVLLLLTLPLTAPTPLRSTPRSE